MPEFNQGEFNQGEFNSPAPAGAALQPIGGTFSATWGTGAIGGGVP